MNPMVGFLCFSQVIAAFDAELSVAGNSEGYKMAELTRSGEEPAVIGPATLPPAEHTMCDPALQAKISHFLELQKNGRYLKDELRKMRDFRNPEFFTHIVKFLDLDQYVSAFAPEVFDPNGIREEDHIEKLREEWLAEDNRRRQSRATTGSIEFVKGGGHPKNGSTQAAVAAARARAAEIAAKFGKK